jgi:hypothetical protein
LSDLYVAVYGKFGNAGAAMTKCDEWVQPFVTPIAELERWIVEFERVVDRVIAERDKLATLLRTDRRLQDLLADQFDREQNAARQSEATGLLQLTIRLAYGAVIAAVVAREATWMGQGTWTALSIAVGLVFCVVLLGLPLPLPLSLAERMASD